MHFFSGCIHRGIQPNVGLVEKPICNFGRELVFSVSDNSKRKFMIQCEWCELYLYLYLYPSIGVSERCQDTRTEFATATWT